MHRFLYWVLNACWLVLKGPGVLIIRIDAGSCLRIVEDVLWRFCSGTCKDRILSSPLVVENCWVISIIFLCTPLAEAAVHKFSAIVMGNSLRSIGHPDMPRPYNLAISIKGGNQCISLVVRSSKTYPSILITYIVQIVLLCCWNRLCSPKPVNFGNAFNLFSTDLFCRETISSGLRYYVAVCRAIQINRRIRVVCWCKKFLFKNIAVRISSGNGKNIFSLEFKAIKNVGWNRGSKTCSIDCNTFCKHLLRCNHLILRAELSYNVWTGSDVLVWEVKADFVSLDIDVGDLQFSGGSFLFRARDCKQCSRQAQNS